jgi:hypothetical protein
MTMTATTFRFRLEVLGVSVRRFATMTGVDYETAMAWGFQLPGGGAPEFPPWVEAQIAAWERDGVPKGLDRP